MVKFFFFFFIILQCELDDIAYFVSRLITSFSKSFLAFSTLSSWPNVLASSFTLTGREKKKEENIRYVLFRWKWGCKKNLSTDKNFFRRCSAPFFQFSNLAILFLQRDTELAVRCSCISQVLQSENEKKRLSEKVSVGGKFLQTCLNPVRVDLN